MRVLSADPVSFSKSQLRFVRLLTRYWWLLALLLGYLQAGSIAGGEFRWIFSLGSLLVGWLSFAALLRVDLPSSTPSLAFALVLFLALSPLKALAGVDELGQQKQLWYTLQYLNGVYLSWTLLTPCYRRRLAEVISLKQTFLQRAGDSPPPSRSVRRSPRFHWKKYHDPK